MEIKLNVSDTKINCLLLNNPAIILERFLADWTRARIKIVADGALSLLEHLAASKGIDVKAIYPDYVIGDNDTVKPDALDRYKKSGGQVIVDKSLETTDMDKCLDYYAGLPTTADEWLIVHGAMGGPRADLTIGALHSLLRCKGAPGKIKLLEGDGAILVVSAGETRLRLEDALMARKCGLFSLTGPIHVRTDGLRWNLNEQGAVQMGERISVCNEVMSTEIVVKTEQSLIFTIQLK